MIDHGGMWIGPRNKPPLTHPNYASSDNKFMAHGAMGIRTPDLLNAIEALYQLSYDPANVSSLFPTISDKPFNKKTIHRKARKRNRQ